MIEEKRNMILLWCSIIVLVVLSSVSLEIQKNIEAGKEQQSITVVIDPGHGGIDPGKVGINGAYEKNVNLAICKYLKGILKKKKINVIMTREMDEGLYSETDSNKKIADMINRVEMMNDEKVDLIISVHQNSFSSENSKGAQVFYSASSKKAKNLAEIIQEEMISNLGTWNHRQAKENTSYYLLRKTVKPAVIVECGFLSNSEEAEKLCEKKYQRQVAWAIAQGLVKYLQTVE